MRILLSIMGNPLLKNIIGKILSIIGQGLQTTIASGWNEYPKKLAPDIKLTMSCTYLSAEGFSTEQAGNLMISYMRAFIVC